MNPMAPVQFTLVALYKHEPGESHFTGAASGRAGSEGVHAVNFLNGLGTEVLAEVEESGRLAPIEADGCSAPHDKVSTLSPVCEAFAAFAPQAVGLMSRLTGDDAPMSVSMNARAGYRTGDFVLNDVTLIASMDEGTIVILEGRIGPDGGCAFEDRSDESPSLLLEQLKDQRPLDYSHVRRYALQEALDCFGPLLKPWTAVVAQEPFSPHTAAIVRAGQLLNMVLSRGAAAIRPALLASPSVVGDMVRRAQWLQEQRGYISSVALNMAAEEANDPYLEMFASVLADYENDPAKFIGEMRRICDLADRDSRRSGI